MRRLLLLLCCVSTVAAAGVPVVTLPTQQQLLNDVGQPFAAIRKVVVRGDYMAVLNDQTEYFHIFRKQSNGAWQQITAISLPGVDRSRVLDFDFDGSILAYTRRDPPDLFPRDGVSRLYAAVATSPDWGSYSTQELGTANGMVAVENRYLAVSLRRGVDIYHWLGATWNHDTLLPQSGLSTVSDNANGPVLAFDGARIAMGTNEIVGNPNGAYEYVLHDADVYERDASGTWSYRARVKTDFTHFNATRMSPFPVYLRNDQLSVNGRLFRGNSYGDWEQTADLTPVSYSLSRDADLQPTRTGFGVLRARTGTQDIYTLGGDGLWHVLTRLSSDSAIIAVDGNTAILRRTVNGTTSYFVAALDGLASQVPRAAEIEPPTLQKAAAAAGQSVEFTGRAWTPTAGAWMASMEARLVGVTGAGDWIPMAAVDGAFNDAFEIATVQLPVSGSLGRQVRVCLRVTDSAGHVTELLDEQTEPCPVLEVLDGATRADNAAPSAPEITLAAAQIGLGASNVVYAFADDSSTPDGSVAGLHFQIDSGTWRSLTPFPGFSDADFSFGNPYQPGQGVLPPATTTGSHVVCVRAVDAAGHVSPTSCTGYQVLP